MVSGKCAVIFFTRWIILELLNLVICDWCLKVHFKAIIHVAFITTIEMFTKIFIREISNILLILNFSHIFIFSIVLEIISRKIFFLINVYFYLTVPFCLEYNDVVHRWKAYEKANNLTYYMFEISGEMWELLVKMKLTKIQPLPKNAMWMN